MTRLVSLLLAAAVLFTLSGKSHKITGEMATDRDLLCQ